MSFFYGDTKTDELIVGQTSSSNGYIDLYDSGTSNKITLRAPNSITTSYNLTLPDTVGTENQIMTIDGTDGNLLFSDAAPNSNRVIFQVKNETGTTIAKGTPVYFDGISGQNILVAPADASNADKMPAGGILNEALANNQEGIMIEQGKLTNIDMSSYSVNDGLYVAVGGGLSNVKPGYPNLIQNIARVTKNVANGSYIVTCPSRTNDVPNLGDSNIWIGKGSGLNTTECPITGDVTTSNTGVFTINAISNTATITSTANITMNTDQAINFRNTASNIYSSAANQLDLKSATEIKLSTPTANITNNLKVGDTLRVAENGTGLRMTNVGAFDNDGGDFRIFATNSLKLSANGDTNTALTIDSTLYNVNIHNDLLPNTADGSALGSTTKEWSDLYLADGAVINLGNDQDVTVTHIADTGLRLNTTSQLQFRDASEYINSSVDGQLDLNATNEIQLSAARANINGETVYGVNTFVSGGASAGARLEIKSSSNNNSIKSIVQTVASNNNVHYFHANSGGQTGEMMHILYYNANASGSANIDFNASNLYSGTGANRYLELSTSGQGATLIWIDNASSTIAGWRIINTGGAVAGS